MHKAAVVELVGRYANWLVSDIAAGRVLKDGKRYLDTTKRSSARETTGRMDIGRMSDGVAGVEIFWIGCMTAVFH